MIIAVDLTPDMAWAIGFLAEIPSYEKGALSDISN